MIRLQRLTGQRVTGELNQKGYAIVPQFLPNQSCEELIQKYNDSDLYRKTITMERHSFGSGEYKYFKYPLPDLIQTVRGAIYPKLAPIANAWMKMLNVERQFPDTFDELQGSAMTRIKPTVLILKYDKGGYNTLHQDIYGDIFFPFQLVFCLNEPDDDYTGGEFVLTQQIPRAQSKAIVLGSIKETC